MTTHTTLSLAQAHTQSPLERDDLEEMQEGICVINEEALSYLIYPNPSCFFLLEKIPSKNLIARIYNPLIIFNTPILDLTQRQIQALPPTCLVPKKNVPHYQETSISKTYFDKEFGGFYFMPNSFFEANRFIEKYQVEGGYCGLSCCVGTKIKNLAKKGLPEERCDIITLIKNPRQVEYEQQSMEGYQYGKCLSFLKVFFDPLAHQFAKKLQKKQSTALEEVTLILQTKIKKWNYDSFLIADKNMLLTLGYAADVATRIHLLALFYKKVPQNFQ